ncbi:hypothetical protein TKK_0009616 [Trichogramma kaykai]
MILGNVPYYLRTHVKSMKLIALCKEKNFDPNVVYERIVQDIKLIEESGLKIDDKIIKGSLSFICGDNLGSHSLGGFVENFSKSNYMCRFCPILRKDFLAENGHCLLLELRTPKSYNKDVALIGKKNDHKGIKFNSIFNQLKYYHVCAPGLPPWIGHDLFEGVIAYDLL